MFRLVYMSKSKSPMVDAELDDILQKASMNNAAVGVTGLLVYVNDAFFQVLEGSQTAVEAVYDKVFMDPRHHKARILQQRKVVERRFPAWTMGFCRLSGEEKGSDQFWELSRMDFEEQIPAEAGDDLLRVMHGFSEARLKAKEPLLFD